MASSLVAAADIDDTASTDITENILTNTLSDESISLSQTDNNIDSQTIEKEVDTRNDNNTYDTETTSENKKIVEKDKNLKNSIKEGTVEATPNSGKAGDTINLHIYASGTALYSTKYVFDITAKLNDTVFFTGIVIDIKFYKKLLLNYISSNISLTHFFQKLGLSTDS